jgi:hypothetical protein
MQLFYELNNRKWRSYYVTHLMVIFFIDCETFKRNLRSAIINCFCFFGFVFCAASIFNLLVLCSIQLNYESNCALIIYNEHCIVKINSKIILVRHFNFIFDVIEPSKCTIPDTESWPRLTFN